MSDSTYEQEMAALLALALGNLNDGKCAFVTSEELQQAAGAVQAGAAMPPDQAQAQMAAQAASGPIAPGAAIPEQGGAPLGLSNQNGVNGPSEMEIIPGSGGQVEGSPGGGPGYDQLVDAVRQVMQEMGAGQPGAVSGEAEPAATPETPPKPAAGRSKGKVDPEEFARLQSAMALVLEHLGLVTPGEVLTPEAAPAEAEAAQASGMMGAAPGKASKLPEDGEAPAPFTLLDPAAGEAIAQAGQRASRLTSQARKLAALIKRG